MLNVIINNILLSYLSVIITNLIGFFMVPLMINYLGMEIYGIWMLGTSIIGYLSLSNFGIPTAVTTLMAKTSNEHRKEVIFVNSFLLLMLISIFLIIVIAALNFFSSKLVRVLGNIKNEYINIGNMIIMIMLIGFLVRSPFQLAMSAFSSYQKIYILKIYEIFMSIANIVVLLTAQCLQLRIISYVFFNVLLTNMLYVVALFHARRKLFYNNYKTTNHISIKVMSGIFKHSLSFFFIGIASTIVWSTDNIIIGNMLTMEEVTKYSVAFKLYSVSFLLFTSVSGVMFPLYGKYNSEQNWVKINEVYVLNLSILPAIAGLTWIGGNLFSRDIILLWTGKEELYSGTLLMFVLGGYGFVLSIVNTHANLLGGMNLVRNTVKLAWLEALLNLLLSIILVKYLGLAGVALGTFLASFFVPFLLLPYYVNHNTGRKVTLPLRNLVKMFLITFLFSVLSAIVEKEVVEFITRLFIFLIISILLILKYWSLMDKGKRLMVKNAMKEILLKIKLV